MKKALIILAVLIVGIIGIVAVAILTYPTGDDPEYYDYYEENGAAYAPADDAQPRIHGLLSYIEYGYNRAYIFGSMHVGNSGFFPLADAVEGAMRRADSFAFEYDLSLDETMEGLMLALYYMFLPDEQTLDEYLSPEAFAHLMEILGTFELEELELEIMMSMRPMAIETLLIYGDLAPALGFDDEDSVDSYVFDFAQANRRTILGLVDAEHQLRLGLAPPIEVEEAAIMAMQNRDAMLSEIRDVVEAYTVQDINALRRLISPDANDDCAYAVYMIEVMMTQRSGEFAHEIDRLLRETEEPTTFFVTIGIAHLLHAHGNTLAVLESQGHTINELWR